MTLNVGVIGYSTQDFDKEAAIDYLQGAFKTINAIYPKIVLVSGLTNLGIPALAYAEAKKLGWQTIGIACEKANDYELFPVDEKIIIGKEWGDESQTFLNSIDILIRIGGGQQSLREAAEFKKSNRPIIEFDLSV